MKLRIVLRHGTHSRSRGKLRALARCMRMSSQINQAQRKLFRGILPMTRVAVRRQHSARLRMDNLTPCATCCAPATLPPTSVLLSECNNLDAQIRSDTRCAYIYLCFRRTMVGTILPIGRGHHRQGKTLVCVKSKAATRKLNDDTPRFLACQDETQ